ncbi:hypothetical protein ACFZC6_05500 [Streptomyces ossamyceticus]|uniref:hypothetical protein n=1 Tax=Streptomyces ossamyceticus TaxID=249581 RepID=UPI0036F157E5
MTGLSSRRPYGDRLVELAAQLHATPGITVSLCRIGAPASDEELDALLARAGGKLPEGLGDFYASVNGFQLVWQGGDTEGEGPDGGSVQFLPIDRLFGDWRGVTWFDDFEGGDRYRAVQPFDLFEDEACGAFWQEDGLAPQSDVHLHWFGEGDISLDISFPTYVDRLIEMRGYRYWQLTVPSGVHERTEAAGIHARVARLFG